MLVLGTELASGAPYIHIQYSSSSRSSRGHYTLARFIPTAALALGLVVLLDELPSSSANELS